MSQQHPFTDSLSANSALIISSSTNETGLSTTGLLGGLMGNAFYIGRSGRRDIQRSNRQVDSRELLGFQHQRSVPLRRPSSRRRRVPTILRDLLNGNIEETLSPAHTRAREQQWLLEHREQYMNEWVALNGGHLIAHGHDARAVYRAAREAGIAIPFIVRVEPFDEPSMGGW
ncbi:MAG: DUF5678 domain-containing protein [Pyrinomonadaceae bacterium]